MSVQEPPFAILYNGQGIDLDRITVVSMDAFQSGAVLAVSEGKRVVDLFLLPDPEQLFIVLADDDRGRLLGLRSEVKGSRFPSLAPQIPQLQLFEREIYEEHGIVPQGHPWLKPVRFSSRASNIGKMEYYRVEGGEAHEVSVGPVHAGIIEPGHFRFQCHGETVQHLEISLGYQHRGIGKSILRASDGLKLKQVETAAGDTSIGHAWAYCQAVEALSSSRVTARNQVIRSIALELERLANHTGDLGALAGDVGYLPTMSFCGRIRGDFLNMTALLCGNRFGRDLLEPGGLRFDLDGQMGDQLLRLVCAAQEEVSEAISLLWKTPSVLARFESRGILTQAQCVEAGIVGVAARASGLERDVRADHPFGIYRFASIPVSSAGHGDVHSRAFVRWLEIKHSLVFIQDRLRHLPEAPTFRGGIGPLAKSRAVVSLVEGWRGEICHLLVTNSAGVPVVHRILDPSFHNWMGLALAVRKQQISDFPMINKSFNLSYCGCDL